MKRLTAFLLVALIGWNIVLTILYLQSKEDTTAATAAQQTKQKVETASVNITSDVTELVAKSENKVVTVTARARGQALDTGSGAVYKVDGKTVYIITNNHVVADGDEAVVTFANGKEQKVDIVGKDELTDLALLKTDVDFKAEAFVMGNSSLVKKGEYVIAMGSPLGIEYQGSVSGSKMAKYNVAGNAYIKELCGKLDIPYKQIGALIMAFSEADERTLEELKNRGIQNGVKDMEIWDKERLHREEPHVSQEARAALYSPNVGIVSPWELALALAEVAVENGVEVKLNTEVKNIEKTDTGYSVETNQGVIDAVCVCNAAGVFADEVNEMVNDATFKIEPNKGEYYLLDKSQGNLVSHVIFQCPNENGKGVLVAPTVHGNLIVGPGVATRISTPAFKTRSCGFCGTPPKMTALRIVVYWAYAVMFS